MNTIQANRIDLTEMQKKNNRLEKSLKLVLGYFNSLQDKEKLHQYIKTQVNFADKDQERMYWLLLDRLF